MAEDVNGKLERDGIPGYTASMFPISDDNPATTTPVVCWLLIASCVGVFIYQLTLGLATAQGEAFIFSYGLVPSRLFGGAGAPVLSDAPIPEATLVTSMFLHGGILHLAGNMLFLWIFGDNVEGAMGHVRFLVFYLLTGIAAALTQGFMDVNSQIPMVGASGAISGVLGAYLLLYPTANVRVLLFLGVVLTSFRIPAVIVLGLWFVFQVLSSQMAPDGQEGGVAFWAHIGGFVAGMLLVWIFVRRTSGPWEDRNRARWLR